MKKRIFFFIMAIWINGHAQEYDFLRFCMYNSHVYGLLNLTEMPNGCLLLNVSSYSTVTYQNTGPSLMKVTLPNPLITDTVFLLEPGFMTNGYLLEPLPDASGDRYVFARTIIDQTKSRSYLNIITLDSDLMIQDSITNFLEDGFVLYNGIKYLLDGEDIIMAYRTNPSSQFEQPDKFAFTRVDLEGNIVFQSHYSDTLFPFEPFTLMVWNETPKKYMVSGADENGYFHQCVLDSTFNILETYKFNNRFPQYMNYYFDGDRFNRLLPVDDTTYLLSSRYRFGWQGGIRGVQVSRRRMETHENLQTTYFHNPENLHAFAGEIIGLEKGRDGSYYLAYVADSGLSHRVTIVKLDGSLNVVSQCYCMESFDYDESQMIVLHDGSIAIAGREYNTALNVYNLYVLIVDENWLGLDPEAEAFIRPYMFYPNPAQERLQLQYSPDVQPKQVELYDLQGRLVRMQQSDLESVNVQGLPAGQYLMKVTLEDGKAYTDKVVKE